MKKLLEPKDSLLTIKYAPDGETLSENPPRFTWMPESDEDIPYRLQVSGDKGFAEDKTESHRNIPYNFFTLDHCLEPGTYYWRYSTEEDGYEYSRARSFTVEEGAARTPLKNREDRYEGVELSHPRIWMNRRQIGEFKERLKEDANYCGFQDFYRASVEKYNGMEFIGEPKPYPGDKRVVSLWRQNYSDCQEALCYIRSLAVGAVMTDDEAMAGKAKRALLTLAGWDTEGPTSRNYNDECSFRVAYALAFGYDWLYDRLTEEEKREVVSKLYVRTRQVASHIIVNSRIHFSLYDSHAVRSLSSVLTPCCIAMLGEAVYAGEESAADARRWLDYTIEYFNVIYTPWGGKDGGWAEGPLYWTTGMAFVIEALNTIKSFFGIDIYKRPFFQMTGDFPYYCNPTDTYRACFSDQSNLGKRPGHKTAFNMRQFAGVSGKGEYNQYFEEVFSREPEIDPDFFNTGWWDFAFDNMVYLHDYRDVKLEAPKKREPVKWFRDIGWVAVNKDGEDPDNHIFFLTKSSPYGCVSHSHGDQNDFVLFAYGEPLAARSGYYVGFNTSMHKDWRRQTRSHNLLLVDGQGQYAGMDKAQQLSAKGQVMEVKEEKNYVYIKENATQAYQINVPQLEDCTREIYFVDQSYFVLVDTVRLSRAARVDWLLHSVFPYEIQKDKFFVRGEKAELEGRFVYCSGGIEDISQTDKFEGVDQWEIEGLPRQHHLDMKTKAAKNHVIVTLLVPSKAGERKVVTPIKDDQGHDVYVYFSYDGNTFSLRTDGNLRY